MLSEYYTQPFVFLSYAHADREFVTPLISNLKKHGITVWIDRAGIPPGTRDWEEQIRTAIPAAYAIILVASPYARSSRVVRDELAIAAMHQRPVYPFWVTGTHWADAIPLGWGRTQYIDARDTRYTVACSELVATLTALQASILPEEHTGKQIYTQVTRRYWNVPYLRNLFFEGRVSRRVVVSVLATLTVGGIATWVTLAKTSTKPPLVYRGHREAVWRVRWSLDGRRIASGGGDHTVQIWYAYSGRPFSTYYGDHNTNIRAIAWSPDSTRIAFGGDDKTIQVRDLATGHLIYIYGGNTDIVWDVAWSPDGSLIASASWDKTVQVWNAQTGQHIYTYRGHSDTVRSIAWSPDSTRIASASRDLLVQVWEAHTGRFISSYSGHPTDTLMCVAWSPNGTYIASSGWDRTVQVWEAITGNHIYTYLGHTEVVMEVAWSPDSKRIASASTDKTVQVWEAVTGNYAYTYRDHTSRVYSVTWSPDGKSLASSQDHAVYVWQPD